MVKVERKKRHLSPTTRLVDSEGRLTTDGFKLIKDLAEFISLIAIEDGEIKANMIEVESLEAISAVLGNVIINGNLVVEGTITTGKIGSNAVTGITAGIQVSPVSPHFADIVSVAVPISNTGITGVLISFTGFMARPGTGSGNFGDWGIQLKRNGVVIDNTPGLFYDDNFAYPVACTFVDLNPGINPVYTLSTAIYSGPGNFTLGGGLMNCSLLKR